MDAISAAETIFKEAGLKKEDAPIMYDKLIYYYSQGDAFLENFDGSQFVQALMELKRDGKLN